MERNFNFDDGFYRWFYQLPDLNAPDKKKNIESVFDLFDEKKSIS